MRVIKFAVLPILAATAAFGQQQWEFGAVGGGGLLNNVAAASPAGAATAGFAPGLATGVFAGQNLYNHLAGEIRYEYMQSDLELAAAGQTAKFAGMSHALHYDVIFHTNRSESRTQFFGAVGGGVKAFLGTGAEAAFQPLSQYGYFTKTQTIKPMVTAGAGVSYRLKSNLYLRTEVRDFMTTFPTEVLTPAPGVKYGRVLHEVVPMVSLVYVK
jgi:hypothetical protein